MNFFFFNYIIYRAWNESVNLSFPLNLRSYRFLYWFLKSLCVNSYATSRFFAIY